jgi:two-component system, OmpR family, osmolarity sensor histidine kinase EnvZ
MNSPNYLASPFAESPPIEERSLLSLGLFWRTFLLLVLLLLAGVAIWFQTLRSLEKEPRRLQTVQQITTALNLTKAALSYSDERARDDLLATLAQTESIRIHPRHLTDLSIALKDMALRERIEQGLAQRSGEFDAGIAESVNGKQALWIGFTLSEKPYWLSIEADRVGLLSDEEWRVWQLLASMGSLVCAGIFAWYINRPYQRLFEVTRRFQLGDFRASPLKENFLTHEIKEVSRGFNRMAERLAKIDEERARMLAGLSHDLRTPLARLRLDAELSVEDPETKAFMVADIEQLDGMIDKFLEYAKPASHQLVDVNVFETLSHLVKRAEQANDVDLEIDVQPDLWVKADPTELMRALRNLVDNAINYGKMPVVSQVKVQVRAYKKNELIVIEVRDHGPGVRPQDIAKLTVPFFRGDAARTEAKGTGLGLGIVEKIVFSMGGKLHFKNHPEGGFVASIELHSVPAPTV